VNPWQVYQVLICRDESQVEHFCGGREKVIGCVAVRKVYRRYGERNFDGEGRLGELQVLYRLSYPRLNVVR
jgi:hypothetical protein